MFKHINDSSYVVYSDKDVTEAFGEEVKKYRRSIPEPALAMARNHHKYPAVVTFINQLDGEVIPLIIPFASIEEYVIANAVSPDGDKSVQITFNSDGHVVSSSSFKIENGLPSYTFISEPGISAARKYPRDVMEAALEYQRSDMFNDPAISGQKENDFASGLADHVLRTAYNLKANPKNVGLWMSNWPLVKTHAEKIKLLKSNLPGDFHAAFDKLSEVLTVRGLSPSRNSRAEEFEEIVAYVTSSVELPGMPPELIEATKNLVREYINIEYDLMRNSLSMGEKYKEAQEDAVVLKMDFSDGVRGPIDLSPILELFEKPLSRPETFTRVINLGTWSGAVLPPNPFNDFPEGSALRKLAPIYQAASDAVASGTASTVDLYELCHRAARMEFSQSNEHWDTSKCSIGLGDPEKIDVVRGPRKVDVKLHYTEDYMQEDFSSSTAPRDIASMFADYAERRYSVVDITAGDTMHNYCFTEYSVLHGKILSSTIDGKNSGRIDLDLIGPVFNSYISDFYDNYFAINHVEMRLVPALHYFGKLYGMDNITLKSLGKEQISTDIVYRYTISNPGAELTFVSSWPITDGRLPEASLPFEYQGLHFVLECFDPKSLLALRDHIADTIERYWKLYTDHGVGCKLIPIVIRRDRTSRLDGNKLELCDEIYHIRAGEVEYSYMASFPETVKTLAKSKFGDFSYEGFAAGEVEALAPYMFFDYVRILHRIRSPEPEKIQFVKQDSTDTPQGKIINVACYNGLKQIGKFSYGGERG